MKIQKEYLLAEVNEWLRMGITLAIIGWLFFLAFNRGLDINIDNQNLMICENAQDSGSKEHLKRCACYYQSGDITCLRANFEMNNQDQNLTENKK
jgi:hypothetical protein